MGELQTKFNSPKLSAIPAVVMRSDNPESKAPEASMKLTWSPVYLASKYIIEVSESSDFKSSEKIEQESTSLNYNAKKHGDYHFRVIASDSSLQQK